MSGRLVGEVFKCAPTDLTPSEMLVLVALAEQARDRDRIARFSTAATIAEHTHLAYGTVRNVLSGLAARGLITRIGGRAHIGKAQDYLISELSENHRIATINGHHHPAESVTQQ